VLTTWGRRIRVLVVAVAAVLLLYGTVAGGDRDFPFGPFAMYAGHHPANGVIRSTVLRATTADGRQVPVTTAASGLRRAELEGQLHQLVTHPARLGRLATLQQRRHPGTSPYVEIRIVQRRWRLHGGAIVRHRQVVLADWHAESGAR
jgi:hypothetical protein